MSIYFQIAHSEYASLNITYANQSIILGYPCGQVFDNCTPYYGLLTPGSYIFEVWGGQGGFDGGKGGYSHGIFSTNRAIPIYIFIGSKGSEIVKEPGSTVAAFNGGGKGYSAHTDSTPRAAGSGGGGTDIRVIGDSLHHRIIVAGGGGGRATSYLESSYNNPGAGGGLNGGDSFYGKGGLQDNSPSVSDETYPGEFGSGGSALYPGTAGGGGGGWYGGSSGKSRAASGGAGGSGYVLNETSYKPNGYKLKDKRFYLKYPLIISGDSEVPLCQGEFGNEEKEKGHSGYGCARITILSQTLPCTYNAQNFLYLSIIIKGSSFLLFIDINSYNYK